MDTFLMSLRIWENIIKLLWNKNSRYSNLCALIYKKRYRYWSIWSHGVIGSTLVSDTRNFGSIPNETFLLFKKVEQKPLMGEVEL